MKNNPKISVIIPVYNVEQYLRDCLDSVIEQTYKNTEILCIENGSTDKSAEILKEYSFKDNRIIILQSPKGVSKARNLGIDSASGEYITFVDSDDVIDKEYIERLYKTATENNVDFAWCKMLSFNDGEKCIPNALDEPTIKYDNLLELMNNNPKLLYVSVWGKLYSKSSIRNIRFPEDIAIAEDKIFSLYYVMNNKEGVFVPQTMYFYRQRENSAMSQNNIVKFLNLIKGEKYILTNICNLVKDEKLKQKMIKKTVNEIYASAIVRPLKDLELDYNEIIKVTYNAVFNIYENKEYFNVLSLKKRITVWLFVMKKYRLVKFLLSL